MNTYLISFQVFLDHEFGKAYLDYSINKSLTHDIHRGWCYQRDWWGQDDHLKGLDFHTPSLHNDLFCV